MSEQKENLYEILNVNENATEQEIKSSYKKLAMKWHPDKNQDKKAEAEEKFKAIASAYAILSDKDKRKEYDFERKNGFKMGNGKSGGFSTGFKNFNMNMDFANDIFKEFFGGRDPFKSMFEDDDDFFGRGFGSSNFGGGSHFTSFSTSSSNMGGSGSSSIKKSTVIINGKKVTKTEKTYIDSNGNKRVEVTEDTGDGKVNKVITDGKNAGNFNDDFFKSGFDSDDDDDMFGFNKKKKKRYLK